MNKFKTLEELRDISSKLKEEGKILVTTNGSFDILHSAHLNILEKAKGEGDVLIVLLNSDNSVRRDKGEKRPIILEDERATMLSALAAVDHIVIFDEDKPLRILEEIKPHKHVKGGSFVEERIREEKELLESWGGEFKNFELEEGFSTTNIVDSILERYNKKE